MRKINDPTLLLQRKAAIPVWRQIETDIEVDIETGAIGPGDRLPSEQELVARYGVNRHTIRMALAKLAARGLVITRQGKGVFVSEEPAEYLLDVNAKWSEVEKRSETKPKGKLIDHYPRPATPRLAQALDINEGDELLVTESLRQASADIATFGYHMFPAERFDGIAKAFCKAGSFTQALAEFHVDNFYRMSTWVDCRLPRPREAKWLAIPIETPVLVMSYVDCDADRRPILYGHAVMPQGALRIRIDSDTPLPGKR